MPAFSRARRESSGVPALIAYVCAIISAILVPAVYVFIGLLTTHLSSGGLNESPVTLGRHLHIELPMWVLESNQLNQLLLIVASGTLFSLLQIICLWLFYKQVFHRAQMGIRQLHHDVLNRCIEHASSQGVTAQRARAEQLLEKSLPQVRHGLVAWYRAIPRSVLILFSCLVLAMLVDVWLTSLAIFSWLLVWKFYRWIEGLDEPQSSEWELPGSRTRLLEMVQEAPLMARLQPGDDFDSLYRGQLEKVLRLQNLHDQKVVRRLPALFFSATLAIALMTLGIGINVLDPQSGLSLHAAVVLTLSLVGAGVAGARLARTQHQLEHVDEAATLIFSFLDQPTRASTSEQLTMGGLRHSIEFTGVTLRDDNDHVLADDLSLKLQPGTLVALLGSDSASVRTIVELLLGFGRPQQGKVTVDGMIIADVHPSTLSQQLVWVGRDGPIWRGSIEENLRGSSQSVATADMAEATREVKIYEQIQSWEDGFTTHVSAHDTRLDSKTRYAIAIARARLASPAVVVVEEPDPVDEQGEDACLAVLQSMVKDGALVVMLPRRLKSLRSADRVVLLKNGRLDNEGKHEDLLSTSDFYRHLNYQLFNPFRNA